jgi:hypothetical protein
VLAPARERPPEIACILLKTQWLPEQSRGQAGADRDGGKGRKRGRGTWFLSSTLLGILRGLVQGAQVTEHVGQGVQVAAVLDLVGDELRARDPADGAPEVGQQEVMQGTVPARMRVPTASCWIYWGRGEPC